MKKDIPFATSLPKGIYIIQDNGMRCFIPPCFSWNVFDNNGKLIAQVSDIDFSCLQSTFDLKELQACLTNEGLKVRGYTVTGAESDGVRQAIRFIVESLENSHRQRK